MGNTSQFSFRSLRGYNAGELSIVRALKTDGFISGGKKRRDGENVITQQELCGSFTVW